MTSSRKPGDKDADAEFRAALGGVTPLPRPNRVPLVRKKPAPIPRQTMADEAAALAQSRADSPAISLWQAGIEYEAEQTYLRTGLGSDVLRKLRRGHWVVQAELDLHGYTLDEAHAALTPFLTEARQTGKRCVIVIHGKGLSSPNREPVLKSKVRRWLMQRDDVLAYSEAPPNAGGGGAVLVLLKGK